MRQYTSAELEAFLDEALAAEEMSAIEQALRADKDLAAKLAQIVQRRGGGVHSIGDIWRRYRISCPSREQLGSYLLGVLDEPVEEYIRFHLQTISCRLCQATTCKYSRPTPPKFARRAAGATFSRALAFCSDRNSRCTARKTRLIGRS
jgi:hypothetical protein